MTDVVLERPDPIINLTILTYCSLLICKVVRYVCMQKDKLKSTLLIAASYRLYFHVLSEFLSISAFLYLFFVFAAKVCKRKERLIVISVLSACLGSLWMANFGNLHSRGKKM